MTRFRPNDDNVATSSSRNLGARTTARRDGGVLKPPQPDSSLLPFDNGIAVLLQGGEVHGHIATSVSTMWSPGKPFSKQWWVWSVIVWADGQRDRHIEDYPPWSYVAEMNLGYLDWDGAEHSGRYVIEWLPEAEREVVRAKLNIVPEDF